MIYRVVLDGEDILDYNDPDLTLIDPTLTMELNTAGSFEFIMPENHKYYTYVDVMVSTIEIYEDDIMIWFGRPITENIDFFKQKHVYCEGPLSFFNDTIQRPCQYYDYSLRMLLAEIIANHNKQIKSVSLQKASYRMIKNRQFVVGDVTVDGADEKKFYREFNYDSTYDALQNYCINAEGGYLFFRRENGTNYIDWLKDMPYTCNQRIEFGLNMLDCSKGFDATEYATCVIPLGHNTSETGKPLTIESINNGSDCLKSEAVDTFGYIVRVLHYSDISNPYDLRDAGQKYLEDSQFNSLSLECSAVDRHNIDYAYDLFRVGQMIECVSNPHLIDKSFPLSKMSVKLDTAIKNITLGLLKRPTLTRITRPEESEDSGSGSTGSWGGSLGDDWEVIPPTESGGTVTAVKMPTHIKIVEPPSKMDYELGEELNFSGIQVQIWCENQVWTRSPNYLNGLVPYNELMFSMDKAPDEDTEFTVVVTWTYKERTYQDTLVMGMGNAELPTSIEIIQMPNKLTYRDGEELDLTGLVVVAKYRDGTEIWTNSKYKDGIIPEIELLIDGKPSADNFYAKYYPDGEQKYPLQTGIGTTYLEDTLQNGHVTAMTLVYIPNKSIGYCYVRDAGELCLAVLYNVEKPKTGDFLVIRASNGYTNEYSTEWGAVGGYKSSSNQDSIYICMTYRDKPIRYPLTPAFYDTFTTDIPIYDSIGTLSLTARAIVDEWSNKHHRQVVSVSWHRPKDAQILSTLFAIEVLPNNS